jgi:ubiquitin carboxyl-terminal hydrolase 5/13
MDKIETFQILQIKLDVLEDGPDKKITRLAIGTPGGFNPDAQKYIYEEQYQIIVLPDHTTFSYPNDDLPQIVCIILKQNL